MGQRLLDLMIARKPCRTLIAEGLMIVAYQNGVVESKFSSPTNSKGIRSKYKIDSIPTVLLALTGPDGAAWRILIGDRSGKLTLLSLPHLLLVEEMQNHSQPISCLSAQQRSGGLVILSGHEDGTVMAYGQQLPSGSVQLFQVENTVDALRCESELIHVHSGWERKIVYWDGTPKQNPGQLQKRLPIVA